MPLTYTGRIVKPGNGAHPSLVDIAVGLSRQPRFAGQTRRQWSVLDHTLFGDELLKQEAVGATTTIRQRRRLAWMLHDAHEAITGDVPTDVKKETTLGKVQTEFDEYITGAFFWEGHAAYLLWSGTLKQIDNRCLRAEAHVVGPPDAASVFEMPDKDAVTLLRALLHQDYSPGAVGAHRAGLLGRPPFMVNQEEHPAVREYLHRMELLM